MYCLTTADGTLDAHSPPATKPEARLMAAAWAMALEVAVYIHRDGLLLQVVEPDALEG